MIDTPYRVERTHRRLGDVNYGVVYEIFHSGDGYVATVQDVVLAYRIVELLNEDRRSAHPGPANAGEPAQHRSV